MCFPNYIHRIMLLSSIAISYQKIFTFLYVRIMNKELAFMHTTPAKTLHMFSSIL